jgi:TonB family protein
MNSASRLLVLGVLLTCASSITMVKLRAQAASGRVCEGPDLRARAAADPRRVAIADDRISLVPPEGLRPYNETRLASTPELPALALAQTDLPARIWLQYAVGRRLDARTAREWQASLEATATQQFSGVAWIAQEAVGVDERSNGGIRLEFTGWSAWSAAEEHVWVWATPFETWTLIASFNAPAGDARWTEAMARSLATLEVHDCTVRWPLAAFVDSAALVRAVSDLPAPTDLPAGARPLFRVSYDSTGGPGVEVWPAIRQIPESYAGPVVAAIRAHLKPRPPLPRHRVFTLRVVAGPQPLVDAAEVAERVPALRRGEGARLRQELLRLPRPDSLSKRTSYIVDFRLLEDGTVDPATARIERSTATPELDAGVLRIVRTLRFTPAAIEGVPTAVKVRIPIEIEPQPGRSGHSP